MNSNYENEAKKSAMGNHRRCRKVVVHVYVLRQEQHCKASLTDTYPILTDAQWSQLLLQEINFIILLPFLL